MESIYEINHSLSVLEDISRLFLSETLSDVVFIVEGKQIVAHKVVLAARSQTFRELLFESTPLTSCKRQIHVNDCSALSFKNFIKYLYTGKLSLSGADEIESREMLALALKYQIKPLVESILEPNTGISQSIAPVSAQKPQKIEGDSDKDIQKPSNAVPLRFEDLANVKDGAVVIEGINPERLFAAKKDFDEKGLTKHKIELNTKGIIVKLKIPVVINLVKFRLLDIEPKRYYSYYVMVSADNIKWETVADYRYFSCRSWQTIFFDQRSVQFIQIVGTHSNEKLYFSSTFYFTIISFFCGLTQRPPKMWNGFWEPEVNIAGIGKGAIVVINGNNYCRNAKMINDYIEFEYKKYNQIYSEFHFDRDSELIVQLPQPIIASSISFYIFGEEKYKYVVKVSVDQIDKELKNLVLVSDKRKQFNCPKWQKITFNRTKVVLISIANIRCLDESVKTFPILAFNCP